MDYSITYHRDYNKVFFYNLNKSIKLAKDIVLTLDLCSKLEQALKVSK